MVGLVLVCCCFPARRMEMATLCRYAAASLHAGKCKNTLVSVQGAPLITQNATHIHTTFAMQQWVFPCSWHEFEKEPSEVSHARGIKCAAKLLASPKPFAHAFRLQTTFHASL
eukprot:1142191-Pelagomonas_calceolata.AAC.8